MFVVVKPPDLLPRSLFDKDPALFRMDNKGNRVKEFNLCVHSPSAVEIVCQNAVKYAMVLRPTTGRYFYWIDDDRPMCRCAKCREYTDSDQALILENAMVKALRSHDPRATLAHLAYRNTLVPPIQVKPDPGIFLEFAPIDRTWNQPLKQRDSRSWNPSSDLTHGKILDLLDANLQLFDRQSAQVLEYWLDVSLFSRWKRPARKLPWRSDVLLEDIKTYAQRGIRHVTSFAVFIDADYVRRFGAPTFVDEYGRGLLQYRPG